MPSLVRPQGRHIGYSVVGYSLGGLRTIGAARSERCGERA